MGRLNPRTLTTLALTALALAAVFSTALPAFGQTAVPTTQPVAAQDAAAGDNLKAATAEADGAKVTRPGIPFIWWLAPLGAIAALYFAYRFYNEVKAADPGDPEMIEIANHVREGAMAYLKRQYSIVAIVFVVLAILLAFMAFYLKVQNGIVPIAFLTGGFFSGLCGYLGMRTATLASNRTAAAARESLNRGLVVAFRAG
ncbi:MAG TPA: sodium/proton-translocating pyrophosphatase, partial [Phycisphaerae bacterium]|nr:sodium/proton-translocating pyrophosphatase [Phycisphaerae bacterium]